MRLRRAGADDIPAIAALQYAAYAKNRGLLGTEPLPLSADYAQIVADHEVWLKDGASGLEGVLIFKPHVADLLIWSVAVAPAAQGRGIGGALLATAERRAAELGLNTLRLYTGEPLKSNIAWYERAGYQRERVEQLADRRLVHMVKHLAGHKSEKEQEMAGRLKGKVALVTAAGQGIGRAIAESFIAEGAKVIATDLDETKLAGLKAAKKLKLDVRSTKGVEALAKAVNKEFGALDVLANVAGFVHQGTVFDCSDDDWDFSFDVNVKSMHRTIRAFLPAMLKKGRGSIINMSSGVSSIKGLPNRYVYGATKAAVIGLTKAVAADFITKGIRCNAICPGTIVSPSLDARIKAVSKQTGKSLKDVREAFIARQPMLRLGTAQEVAALALFLASEESSYITGQPHLVDGGLAL